MKTKVLAQFLLLNFLLLCRPVPIDTQSSWRTMQLDRLGKLFTCQLNESGDFELCTQDRQEDHINRDIRFIVMNLSAKSLVYEGTYQNGYVKWASETEIEILTNPSNKGDILPQRINLNNIQH